MDLKNKNLLVTAKSGFEVTDPATGDVVATVADMGVAEFEVAVDKAQEAFAGWKAVSAKARGVILKRWADLMMENQDDLAMIMTMEQGKPLAESKGEIAYAASFFEWFAEEGKRAYGDIIPSPIAGSRIAVLKEPIGVCGIITPWNFPSAMITRKVGAALAAGCVAVCKPAGETPLSALALGVLAREAGVPDGVFQIVTSSSSSAIGKAMCESDAVKKISFTGSTRVGKILMEQSAAGLKKLSLELGGNAPFIVFEDADLEAAVDGAVACKFRNAGQTCVSANRIFVHAHVYDEFCRLFFNKVHALSVGNGLDGHDVGPLINAAAVEKVTDFVADALDKGGELQIGGKSSDAGDLFFEPTVITGVDKSMKIACEEIFGPVAPVFKFEDDAEVIGLANDTEYGLAAYFYAKDLSRVWRVAEALEFGMVAVNTGILSTEVAPFGGVKESGFGREGSKYGLDDYMTIKYVLMGGV